MKKYLCFALSAFMIFTANPCSASAPSGMEAETNDILNYTVVYEDDDITIIELPPVETWNTDTSLQPFASNKTKTFSKTHIVKYQNSVTIGTYTLTGTFSYNGKSSSCTRAVCSTTIQNRSWSFTSSTARKSGNQAIGSFTVKSSANGQAISQTLKLTCDKNGNVS